MERIEVIVNNAKINILDLLNRLPITEITPFYFDYDVKLDLNAKAITIRTLPVKERLEDSTIKLLFEFIEEFKKKGIDVNVIIPKNGAEISLNVIP